MEESLLLDKLSNMIEEDRFTHSVGVRDMAVKLAEIYGADTEKARLAGILHDCAKNIPRDEALAMCEKEGIELKAVCRIEKGLIHPYLGAYIARKEFGVEDEEILDAIRNHTTGCADMSLLSKIVYLADMIEVNRVMVGIEALRELAYNDLDEALIKAIDGTIRHILNKGGLLDADTIDARNFLICKRAEKKAK